MAEDKFIKVGELAFLEDSEGVKKGEAKYEFRNETFHATYWIPEVVRGAVILSHGYGEYIFFVYEEISRRLASKNLLVFAHDHVGHGRSSGERVQVNSIDEYVDPVLAHVKEVKTWPKMTREDGSPKDVFIIGHSMGGLISVMSLVKNQDLFKGMVLNGPLLQVDPKVATPIKLFVAKFLHSWMPSFSLGRIDSKLISRDPKVGEKFKSDSKVWRGGFKAKHSFVLIQTCELAQTKLKDITIPICVLQGNQDKLVTPEGSKLIFESVGSKDKFYKPYEEAFHNLYVELQDVKEDAMNITESFILERLSG